MYLSQAEQKEFPTLGEANAPNDVPKDFHYAVLIFDSTSVYIPGDERSRTNPGHGYPASTNYYNTFQYFWTKSSDDLNKFVKYLHSKDTYKNKFVFFQVSGLGKVNVDVSISVECQNASPHHHSPSGSGRS